jgi:protein SCO1/2
VRSIAIVFLLALVAGCDSKPRTAAFNLTDITGAQFAREFRLTDHNGVPRTLDDFKGKVVLVFFGYTHCPDACPTTMAELAQVMKALGEDSKRLQVLFVTVDPQRDTPELLARYVPSFHPSFLGLYGNAEETERVAKEFKVLYQKQPSANADYTVDHSTGSYIYDPAGRVRLFAAYGQGAEALLHDIRILLQQTS